MAKKRVHPESFRVGSFQNWPDNIKLAEYKINARVLSLLNSYFNNYWLGTHKIRGKNTFRKISGNKQLQFFKINAQLRRRVAYYTNFVFVKKSKFPKIFRSSNTFYNVLPYWYQRSNAIVVNQRLFKYDNFSLKAERALCLRKNKLLSKTLQIQQFLPYRLEAVSFNVSGGLSGSTALRRYQFNLTHLQPPQWTLFIHLSRHSFKKMVGYISSTPKIKRYSGRYNLLLAQLNIALHWRSSYLFVNVLKNAIEQKKRVPGFLRLFQETLSRLQVNRYNINAILVMATGSFGKMSRTRVLRLGSTEGHLKHSLTTLSQPVSYSYMQAQTIRGTLGLRVWFFWSL